MRYKLLVSYDGSQFNGYQRQDTGRTIQGEIEKTIKKIANEKVTVHASGRTDAGVHAKGQVIHFDVELNISSFDMKRALNSALPDDIFVRICTRVGNDFHSRYDAKSKEYEYLISTGEYNPLLRNYVFQYCEELNVDKMREAAEYIVGEHDFTSFATGVSSESKDCVRTVHSLVITEMGTRVSIKIKGTGFLRHMVRCIAGTLINVGNGKIEPADVKVILDKKDRSAAGPNADSCGLYLSKVNY